MTRESLVIQLQVIQSLVMRYIIDAQGKRLGRIASEAAARLLGKSSPSFTRNTPSENAVLITNASQLALTAKKGTQTRYRRYSGYPGGFKESSLSELIEKRGIAEALRRVISRMLPRNRQRSRLIKRLTVKP